MNKNIIQHRDIVIVGQQPWDVEIGSNCKNIALEFSKQNRVLYVNSPLDRISSLRERNNSKTKKRLNIINGKEAGLIQIGENLWNLYPDCIVESISWMKGNFIFDFINKSNNKKFAESIKKALKELNFSNIILFNDNEILKSFYLKELLAPQISIYYSRDYILATDYWKKHGEKLEPILIAKNDLCVANSTYLRDYCKQYNSNAYYVGQGCDLEVFKSRRNSSLPKELQNVKFPVIGYVGALLSARLDIETIAHIAQKHPEWNIVLVGPEDDDFKSSHLHTLKNIIFAGPKPPDELPNYINAFDVCINPQVVNQLTIGNYPRKIDEYLVMGKAVVATKTKAMDIFKDHIYLAEKKEDYPALIEKALKEDSMVLQNERVEFSSLHTWENNVKEIYKAIYTVSNSIV